MPWYTSDYPTLFKNQPKYLCNKAEEIGKQVLKSTGNEGRKLTIGSSIARNILKTSRRSSEGHR